MTAMRANIEPPGVATGGSRIPWRLAAQKKRRVVGLPVVRKIDRFRNIIRPAFQARPFQGMGVARTAENQFLATNHNPDVASFERGVTIYNQQVRAHNHHSDFGNPALSLTTPTSTARPDHVQKIR